MALKPNQVIEIEMLAAHEEALSSLYKVYAGKFTGYRDFWLKLSFEETEHEMWIRDFQNKAKEGVAYFDKNRFKPQAIKLSTQYLYEKIGEAKNKKLLPINALSIALDLENALLDNRWFEAFATDSAALRILLVDLSQAVKKHRERIKRAWKKERKNRKGA